MNKQLFIKNRNKLFSLMEDDSILVSFSRRGKEKDVEEKCNVNRNYFYLSGVIEYDNIVLLYKKDGVNKDTIFIKPYDEFRAKWHGASKSKEEVQEESGIQDVRYLDTFDTAINYYLNTVKNIYIDIDPSPLKGIKNESVVFSDLIKSKFPFVQIKNARMLFAKARMVKEEEEINEMVKAIEITNKGLLNVLKNMKEQYEYQLESYFDQSIKFNGATGFAFTTIGASGPNATCLHYSANNSLAKDGDLILFDLGASLHMYCADISRTYPINGKYSPRQKQIYNIVLGAQQKAFEAMKPGVTLRQINQVVIKYYEDELLKIGLIKEKEEVSKYYYHGISHHIGLEVHDLSIYDEPLVEGCIISNEPGLYIEEEGIGIRIEDDILITKDGAKNLSSMIVKDPEEIEKLIADLKSN